MKNCLQCKYCFSNKYSSTGYGCGQGKLSYVGGFSSCEMFEPKTTSPQPTASSEDSLETAARNGDVKAMDQLGTRFYNQKRYENAAYWFQQAAKQHNAHALAQLGWMYYAGEGVRKDFGAVQCYWNSAAKSGDRQAQIWLAQFYERVQHDSQRAAYWYEKAALQGSEEAQFQFANYCRTGDGVVQDLRKAAYWFERAAKGNYAKAQRNLAVCYYKGDGVPRDLNLATQWMQRAAENNEPEAQRLLDKIKAERDHQFQQKPSESEEQRAFIEPEKTGAEAGNAASISKNEEPAIEQLNQLIGLGPLKEAVIQQINMVKYQNLRKARGLKTQSMSLHMVFTGNPGTGKTTVARIMASLYKEIGVLSKGQLVEVQRSDLVAGYIGHTAIQTVEKVKEALGGILFIDEAYTLVKKDSGNDFGQEAIDTLLKEMEDHRDEFIVIVAGYNEPMREFIHSNPGLQSRFTQYFDFPDYSAEELNEIFQRQCKKEEYILDSEAAKLMQQHFIQMEANKGENFANAREVRNLFEAIMVKQGNRIIMSGTNDVREMQQILPCDIQSVL